MMTSRRPTQDDSAHCWEQEARAHRSWATAFCRRILGDTHLAEDVYHDAWVHICSMGGRYRERGRLRALLYSVLGGLCLNALRKQRRDRRPRTGPAVTENADPIVAGEEAARVRTALDRLGAQERVAVVMRVCEELSHAEIGSALAVSEGYAAVIVFRAKTRLRALLSEGIGR
jgi:RNA polymerase sigma-70 factor (ECF subfamily)